MYRNSDLSGREKKEEATGSMVWFFIYFIFLFLRLYRRRRSSIRVRACVRPRFIVQSFPRPRPCAVQRTYARPNHGRRAACHRRDVDAARRPIWPVKATVVETYECARKLISLYQTRVKSQNKHIIICYLKY